MLMVLLSYVVKLAEWNIFNIESVIFKCEVYITQAYVNFTMMRNIDRCNYSAGLSVLFRVSICNMLKEEAY